jgi:hypothetical protein
MAEVHSTPALEEFLNGEDGPVYRYLAEQAVRVETLAKLNATGIPVEGANNPEGRGPRVRTGRLRSSITWVPGRDARGPYVDIGTPVIYGRYLETGLRNGATYPFLRPALAAL